MPTTRLKGQDFLTNGTFNVPVGVKAVWVTLMGGGSGGCGTYQQQGGFGGTGGARGELLVRFPVRVTPGAAIPVVIGAGGGVAKIFPNGQFGTAGGDSSFGSVVAGGARAGGISFPAGGGPLGGDAALNYADNGGIGHYGNRETPRHIGGAGGSKGGVRIIGAGDPGRPGPGAPGYFRGGAGGLGGAAIGFPDYGGGAGGAASIWGTGGEGGIGGGLGGSSNPPVGDDGGHPPSTNGHDAPITSYGAGGGGGGGSRASFNAKLVWGGAGASGYGLVEWFEEGP